ncbi:MAG TPA: TlyA family RNA methyltransferase [Candidatus Angelobacter sp.]|nr:TlyA family RNA methyltransferase [Candidatus Angelobacter sp.]
MKVRIDKLLVERGVAASRERAQAMVLAGRVLVDGQKVEKAGAGVDPGADIRLLGEDLKYVGRGGLKLEAALDHWKIDPSGRTCLDVGASTGGFTDCLLQRGAAQVIAVDTGYGQIAVKLRSDPRVQLLEKTNARFLTAEHLRVLRTPTSARPALAGGPEHAASITLVAIDVSFISVTLILPAVLAAAFVVLSQEAPQTRDLLVLIKPQFEAGRELVGKGGIVRDAQVQQGAVAKVAAAVAGLGGLNSEVMESPILGMEGNREFFLHAEFR